MTASKSKSKRVRSDDEVETPVVQKVVKSKAGKTTNPKSDAPKSTKSKVVDYGPLQPMRNQIVKDLETFVNEKLSATKSTPDYVTRKEFETLVKCIYSTYCSNGKLFQKKYKSLFTVDEPVSAESDPTTKVAQKPKKKKREPEEDVTPSVSPSKKKSAKKRSPKTVESEDETTGMEEDE